MENNCFRSYFLTNNKKYNGGDYKNTKLIKNPRLICINPVGDVCYVFPV